MFSSTLGENYNMINIRLLKGYKIHEFLTNPTKILSLFVTSGFTSFHSK